MPKARMAFDSEAAFSFSVTQVERLPPSQGFSGRRASPENSVALRAATLALQRHYRIKKLPNGTKS
jgi:hypothetical protein